MRYVEEHVCLYIFRAHTVRMSSALMQSPAGFADAGSPTLGSKDGGA